MNRHALSCAVKARARGALSGHLPLVVAANLTFSAVFLLLLGKDYFIIPTLIACVLSLMILRGPIEAGEVSDDE